MTLLLFFLYLLEIYSAIVQPQVILYPISVQYKYALDVCNQHRDRSRQSRYLRAEQTPFYSSMYATVSRYSVRPLVYILADRYTMNAL